jgi:3-hydroxyacyl-[acyl-carrier-protein] dehydratase
MTSPVLAGRRVVRDLAEDAGKWSAALSVVITGDEPVFAGHYPDFPIFPGVCVLECVRRGAEALVPAPAGALTLAAVESTRFQSAVYPGDVLSIELQWVLKGTDWRCSAKVETERGPAASVRLRYRSEVAV